MVTSGNFRIQGKGVAAYRDSKIKLRGLSLFADLSARGLERQIFTEKILQTLFYGDFYSTSGTILL